MDAAGAQPETHVFQAEVAELLNLMVHSVYSETDIFLRELISNAADACDKLRYEAIAKPDLLAGADELAIRLIPDKAAGTLTIADNGIGMDRAGADRQSRHHRPLGHQGLPEGPGRGQGRRRPDRPVRRRLLCRLHGRRPHRGDQPPRRLERGLGVDLVRRRRASRSRRRATSRPSACRAAPRSVLHLKEDAKRYLEPFELERMVRTYSDHILFPIELVDEKGEARQVNAASALWQRAKSEVKPEDYTQAYRSIAMAFDEPALTLHYKVEGRQSYAVLLFVPSTPPFDLGDPDRKGRIKLYVRRVFITDDADLLPPWLRFVRGVVDSEDLPLNISREMLQNNPQVDADPQRPCQPRDRRAGKHGGQGRRDLRQDLGRLRPGAEGGSLRGPRAPRPASGAHTLRHDGGRGGLRSLKQYVADLKPNQTEIYYLVGESAERVKSNPEARGRPCPRH